MTKHSTAHIVYYICNVHINSALLYNCTNVYQIIVGHLCYHFEAVINNSAMNILVPDLW